MSDKLIDLGAVSVETKALYFLIDTSDDLFVCDKFDQGQGVYG